MPANTKVEICNMGIGHLGIDKDIGSLTENSKEARVCNKWIDTVMQAVLRDHNWGFARKFETLALVEENPTIEWAYSYRYPSDCMFFRRLLNTTVTAPLNYDSTYPFQNALAQLQIPFLEGADDEGKLIYTNMPEAQGEYTFLQENGLYYPPDFVIAASYLLAAYAGPSLAAGDPFKLAASAMNNYRMQIEIAASNTANESQSFNSAESGLSRSRY